MTLLKEKDYGTPKIESDNNVTGYVDGIESTVKEGDCVQIVPSVAGGFSFKINIKRQNDSH